MYLLHNKYSEKVSLFKAGAEHENHDNHPTRGLSVNVKKFIREKFEEFLRKANAQCRALTSLNSVEGQVSLLMKTNHSF